jgi:hypothetical protein
MSKIEKTLSPMERALERHGIDPSADRRGAFDAQVKRLQASRKPRPAAPPGRPGPLVGAPRRPTS